MRALTVRPGTANSARVEERARSPTDRAARCSSRRWRSACAAPTWRSSPASTAGRRPGKDRLVLGHESLGRVLEAPAGQRLQRRATWSSASCAGPTRSRARTAPSASGTCAATAGTPSTASRRCDGFCSERWRVEPELRGQGRPAPRAPRRADGAGERRGQGVGAHRADRPARACGSRGACWSPAPGRSACSRR